MPMEDKIEGLTTAIVNLTAVITALSGDKGTFLVRTNYSEEKASEAPVSETKEVTAEEKTRKPRKTKAEKEAELAAASVPAEDGKVNVSYDETMGYARKKVAEGHDIQIIKAKTAALGGSSIGNLTQEGRNKLWEFLDTLELGAAEDEDEM